MVLAAEVGPPAGAGPELRGFEDVGTVVRLEADDPPAATVARRTQRPPQLWAGQPTRTIDSARLAPVRLSAISPTGPSREAPRGRAAP